MAPVLRLHGATGLHTGISLNSYGYKGVKAMFGPKFGSGTGAVYGVANTATQDTIVAQDKIVP